jgi:hypothetical protein
VFLVPTGLSRAPSCNNSQMLVQLLGGFRAGVQLGGANLDGWCQVPPEANVMDEGQKCNELGEGGWAKFF